MKHSPAVSFLINLYSLSESQISSIPRSGPKNRLVKGDILKFVGPFTPIKHSFYSKTLDNVSPDVLKTLVQKLSKFNLEYIEIDAKSPFRDLKLESATLGSGQNSLFLGRGLGYFTIASDLNLEFFYLKPNQVGILHAKIQNLKSKKSGDIIDELSWENKTLGLELDLIVNSQFISKQQAQSLLSL